MSTKESDAICNIENKWVLKDLGYEKLWNPYEIWRVLIAYQISIAIPVLKCFI